MLALAGAAAVVLAATAVGAWMWAPWRDGGARDLPDGAIAHIAETVPADIRETGRLVIGVNVPYAPMEFKNADGQLVGFDVELMNGVARVLGLVPDYRQIPFDQILPSVQAGTIDVGVSSVTDTGAMRAALSGIGSLRM